MAPTQDAGAAGVYNRRGVIRAIREKSLSRLKRLARCPSAIDAIRVSIVDRLKPLDCASREMAAASRYVEKPRGSSISQRER